MFAAQGGDDDDDDDYDNDDYYYDYDYEKKSLAVVDILLKNGAEANAQDRNGKTSLMFAADRGNKDIAALLSKNGDIDAQDTNGWTALMYAARKYSTATMQALKKAGANVNLKNKDGKNAEMIAAENRWR